MRTVIIRVSGLVQGVSFRYYAKRRASGLGLSGWVRNLADGQVEAVVKGAPDKVETFIDWMKKGPTDAVVSKIAVTEDEITAEIKRKLEGLNGFEIAY